MRALLLAALLLVLVPLTLISCAKSKSASAGRPEGAPGAASSQVPAGRAAAPEAGKAASYEGTWAMVVGTMELEPGGTVRFGAGFGAGEGYTVRWRKEGDHVVISFGDGETTARLSEDGSCLKLMEVDGGVITCLRVGAEAEGPIAEAVAEMAGPGAEGARVKAEQAKCLSNLRSLSTALMMYANDHSKLYPLPGTDWEAATFPYVMSKSPYQCPSDRETPSYQLNQNLTGGSVREVTRPHEMVALFESDDGKAVAYRHNDGANYAFADGHAKWFSKGAEKGPAVAWEFEPGR